MLEKNIIGISKIEGKCNGIIIIKEYKFNKCIIDINLKGLNKNKKHAFHIHETGDLTNGCDSLLAHYNPFNKNHGGLNDEERHVGDFGNLLANSNGVIKKSIIVKDVKLKGKYSIIGRSFVIHEGEDDLGKGKNKLSKLTGNAGNRLGCGVIGYSKNSKLYF